MWVGDVVYKFYNYYLLRYESLYLRLWWSVCLVRIVFWLNFILRRKGENSNFYLGEVRILVIFS